MAESDLATAPVEPGGDEATLEATTIAAAATSTAPMPAADTVALAAPPSSDQPPPPPPDHHPARVAVGLFVVGLAIVGLGGAAFTLGWFDRDGGDAEAVTTISTPTANTVVATAPPITSAPRVTTGTTVASASTAPAAAPVTTVSERYAGPQCPTDGPCIEMSAIRVVDGEYSIAWSANFTPSVSDTHAHFFWDVYEPAQVGSASVDRAPWELTAEQPFVPTAELRLTNRPADATGICVTPADARHAVIDPATFHCALVGPDGNWTEAGA